MIKCFLLADYAVDKAIFSKDVEQYRTIRFESARRKIAKLIYERFITAEGEYIFPKASSAFDLIHEQKGKGGVSSAQHDPDNWNRSEMGSKISSHQPHLNFASVSHGGNGDSVRFLVRTRQNVCVLLDHFSFLSVQQVLGMQRGQTLGMAGFFLWAPTTTIWVCTEVLLQP